MGGLLQLFIIVGISDTLSCGIGIYIDVKLGGGRATLSEGLDIQG